MQFRIRCIVVVIFLFICSYTAAQELPPIQNFSPQDYHAETQNWSIAEDESKTIIVANNEGLLTFNGEDWQTINSPNKSIIRSIKVVDDKIYTGMYMDFGFWIKNEFGSLVYESLTPKLNIPLLEDEQFWKIISLQDWLLFQSLNRIYIYNTKDETFNVIDSDFGITKAFKLEDEIFYQNTNKGLYKIEGGKGILVSSNRLFIDHRLINIFKYDTGLLIQTEDAGIYILRDGIISDWNAPLNQLLVDKSLYNSIHLENGNFALGTIANGLFLVDPSGNLIYNINRGNGLENNTVLSLFEDSEKNLWLGLDNGLSCINIDSPFKVYNDNFGLIGAVYDSEVFNGKLFLGTNQGLFYRDLETNDYFKLIPDTQGQVWCLFNYQDQLFCGHDSGTFIIDNMQAKLISNIEGTWNIKHVQSKPNLLIQGNYSGLYILEKVNRNWRIKHKISGYDISTKFFEFVSNNELLISHEYKGIIKLRLNSDLSKVETSNTDESFKGLKSSLVKHNDNIFYAYEKGVFKYDTATNTLVQDSILSEVYDEMTFESGKLISDETNNRLWSFSKDYLNYTEPGNLSTIPKLKSIPLSYELIKSVSGYENILPINSNKYIIGTTSGYIVLDLNKLTKNSFTTSINSITNTKDRNDTVYNNVIINENGKFSNEEHNLEFSYSINEFDKFFIAEYQYQLLGIYDSWSEWSKESTQVFENLPYGNYIFNVRGRINNKITDNIASYNFTIERPWYLTHIAIGLYVIGLILLALGTHNIYKVYYKKQQQQILETSKRELDLKELENQKQIMRIQNENLEKDIENKNRELAISTMSLIKKNEFLNTIKDELKNGNQTDIKQVIRIIDKNINNTDDWKLFEEAFNNADKDFLKKIKSKHGILTPNDLRLCAYLRLNLSSKEIAPLLNISPRSVEVKRYRLRKKMELPHKTSLTNYILEI